MLYLSQFVFQSILFSKKKARAGDSWHPLVPSGEEELLSSRGQCSPPTSPARPPHPQTGCRQTCPAGRELGWVDRFHRPREGKKPGSRVPLTNAQPSLPVLRPTPQPVPFGGPGAPGRTERGAACKAVAGRGCSFPQGPPHPAQNPWLLQQGLPSESQARDVQSANVFS